MKLLLENWREYIEKQNEPGMPDPSTLEIYSSKWYGVVKDGLKELAEGPAEGEELKSKLETFRSGLINQGLWPDDFYSLVEKTANDLFDSVSPEAEDKLLDLVTHALTLAQTGRNEQ